MKSTIAFVNTNRDFYIDFLRFLGLSLIILVHVNCPDWLKQLRSFDVPLMVFVSGLSCTFKGNSNVGQWLWKRTKRLVIPTYIFFSAYMLLLFVMDQFTDNSLIKLDEVIGTYFMLNNPSVGYIYIIRVFLLVMLCTPPLVSIIGKAQTKKVDRTIAIYITILILFVSLELLVTYVNINNEGFVAIFYSQCIIYAIAYSIPFLIGLSLKNLEEKHVKHASSLALIILIVSVIVYYVQNGLPFTLTPTYKYPPHAYYLIYGGCICTLLYCLRFIKPVHNCVNRMRLPIFIGQNTIWIYFWHILFLLFVGRITNLWVAKFILVYTFSIIAYYIQFSIVKRTKNEFLNKFFIG